MTTALIGLVLMYFIHRAVPERLARWQAQNDKDLPPVVSVATLQ
jgi:hypothetical protein